MTDFSKVLEQAKDIQKKMKETQESLKKIEVEGISGGGAVKICLNGDGELTKMNISPETMKENKEILEDLIIAAHTDAKKKVKNRASEELSKITGGIPLPAGFKCNTTSCNISRSRPPLPPMNTASGVGRFRRTSGASPATISILSLPNF